MRRFALALVVGLLTFASSGAWALVISEPCTRYDQLGREDNACPPTCVTCGCCAQAVEPIALQIATSPDLPALLIQSPAPRFPKTVARDILHVPKPRIA
jgi:hypothetical protein